MSNLKHQALARSHETRGRGTIHHSHTEKVEDHIEVVPWKIRETKHYKEILSQEISRRKYN
jgi:hypothetical protein